MVRVSSSLLLGLALFAGRGSDVWAEAVSPFRQLVNRAPMSLGARENESLPPLGEDTIALAFADIFQPTIGDRGPSFRTSFRALDGRRVRVSGYLVREALRTPGLTLLAPWPTKVENDGFCQWEDLPPQTLHLLLPETLRQRPVPYRPGKVWLEGVLQIGPRPMPDGRNAIAVLTVDEASTARLFSLPTP